MCVSGESFSYDNMTIDSGWCKITKTIVPDAYTEVEHIALRQNAHVTFIDGQIKLMKPDFIRSWAEFMRLQIYSTVDKAFALGAAIVVLGFDDYAHVPNAKHPTQRKRSNHVAALNFCAEDELPPSLPEDWNAAMRNRVFKTKVVGLIARNIAEKYKDHCKTLILDWVDKPRVYGKPMQLPSLFDRDDLKRGECDIKAFSWMHMDRPLLIESTDGDFLPMALIQLEKSEQFGQDQMDLGQDWVPPTIFLHRMKTNIVTNKKRPAGSGSSKPTKREYEFVHVNRIRDTVQREMICLPADQRNMSAMLFGLLVAITGCDFALNLPGIGPTKLWALRAEHNAVAIGDTVRENPASILLYFVIKIYTSVYKKYIQTSVACRPDDPMDRLLALYGTIYNSIKNHASQKPPRIMPWAPARMLAHIHNALWTVQYWSQLHEYPDPLSVDVNGTPMYGFANIGGRVEFVGV